MFSSRLPFVSSHKLVNGDRCYVCTRLFLCHVQNGLKRQLLHDSSKKKKKKKCCFWCSFPVGFFLKPNSRANRTWSTLLITFFWAITSTLPRSPERPWAQCQLKIFHHSNCSTRLKTGRRHSTRRSWHVKFGKFLALTELLQICDGSRVNSGSFHCFCFKTSDRACRPWKQYEEMWKKDNFLGAKVSNISPKKVSQLLEANLPL